MIVRNEAAVIERCLDAALPVIDAVSICDTGSSDDTIARARRWMRRNGVRGSVHRHVWNNFGENRSRAIVAARRTLTRLGWSPAETYLLFLDADMELGVERFSPAELDAEVYEVVQRNGGLAYPNVRLARADLAGRFVGATHEYYAAPPGARIAALPGLSIDDRNDGGSRGDKFERDARLLEEELRAEPDNARAMFYLAQSYRALGDLPRALLWYRRRIGAGGWSEEVWYSIYAIGLMYVETREIRRAVGAFHAALRFDPARAEPWFHLATLFRNRGRHRLAAAYARRGLELGPSDRRLFVQSDAWVGLLRELSIAGFYAGRHTEGRDAIEALVLRRGVPPHETLWAVHNSAFYAAPLSLRSLHALRPTLPPRFVPCNPSILCTDEGFLVNVRAVSYRIDAWQRYVAAEEDGVLRTRNFLMRLDRDLRLVDQAELEGSAPVLWPSSVVGFEDCRLVAWSGGTGATCTTTQHHPLGSVRISLLRIDGQRVAEHLPLAGYGDDSVQKNWLPFADRGDGSLRAVYGYEPLTVLALDADRGRAVPVVERRQGRNLGHWRGSAGPVDLPAEEGGGRLLMVHEVAYLGRRYYLHRFVRVDEEWRITAVSPPFYFRRLGIEFACGMCLSHAGDDLVLAFGVDDGEAYLARLPLRGALGLLRPLDD